MVEHTLNLGAETRMDNTVKECIETAEDDRTDYDADNDFHACVDLAFYALTNKHVFYFYEKLFQAFPPCSVIFRSGG